jgi:oligo-1,6-glucosidase
MDAFQFISKDNSFPIQRNKTNQNNLHEYIQENEHEVLSKYDMMICRRAGSSPVEAMKFVDPDRKRIRHQAFTIFWKA